MAEDPFIDELREVVTELGQRARAQVVPGSDRCSCSLEAAPAADDGAVRVRIWMVIEPYSEEQPVEEDEVTFTLAVDSIEEVAFRRFFLDQRLEPRLLRDAETEARLVAEIRAFFCERMGVGSGV